jgi:hypothetical protein
MDAVVAQLISSISDKEKSVRGSCVESLVALGQQHPPHVISALCIYLQQASNMIIGVSLIIIITTITITSTTTALADPCPAAMVQTPLRSRMSLPQSPRRNPYRSSRRSSSASQQLSARHHPGGSQPVCSAAAQRSSPGRAASSSRSVCALWLREQRSRRCLHSFSCAGRVSPLASPPSRSSVLRCIVWI